MKESNMKESNHLTKMAVPNHWHKMCRYAKGSYEKEMEQENLIAEIQKQS